MRSGDFRLREIAPAKYRRPKDAEVIVADQPKQGFLVGTDIGTPGYFEIRVEPDRGRSGVQRACRRNDAGCGSNLPDHAAPPRRAQFRGLIGAPWQDHLRHEDVRRIETEVRRSERHEAPDGNTRAHQQHHGQRDLGYDQRAAGLSRPCATAKAAARALHRVAYIGPDQLKRGSHPEQDSGQHRNREGEDHNLAVYLNGGLVWDRELRHQTH